MTLFAYTTVILVIAFGILAFVVNLVYHLFKDDLFN
jgi:uncharacterized membrane protein